MTNRELIERALDLATGHHTHPNPSVGAVVTDATGEVVGEGFHLGPGHPHAEVVALEQAGASALGGSLFVTLEPCSHHGRTPPCVEAVISSGVSRVFVGVEDPDHRVAGAGIAALGAAGVEVAMWESSEEAESVDPAYFHHRRTGRARVTWKYAMTLDGSVAAADGTSRWITSEAARRDVHVMRSEADAVVVGAGTIRADDPLLDNRLADQSGTQPLPVIVAGSGSLPESARIWSREPLVVSPTPMPIPAGELVVVGGNPFPDPRLTVELLGERGLLDVILEGGPTLASSWWDAGVVTRGYVYIGGLIGGGGGIAPVGGVFSNIENATGVTITDVQTLGPDVRIGFH